jgi:hypothetical protein
MYCLCLKDSIASFFLFQRVLSIYLLCAIHRRGRQRRLNWSLFVFVDLILWFSFCRRIVVWPQHFMLANQAFYLLRHTTSPQLCGYFGGGVSQTLEGLVWTLNPLDIRAQPFTSLGWQVYHQCLPTQLYNNSHSDIFVPMAHSVLFLTWHPHG